MRTFLELQRDLATRLEYETVLDRFTDADRKTAINKAYVKVTERLSINTGVAIGSIVLSNVQPCAIPIPDDMLKLHEDGVYWRNATNQLVRLKSISLDQLVNVDPNYLVGSYTANDFNNVAPQPIYYCYDPRDSTQISFSSGSFSNVIWVTPRPDTGTLNYSLRYVKKPPNLNSDSDLPWGGRFEAFNDCLSALAAFHLLSGGKGQEFVQLANFNYAYAEKQIAEFEASLTSQLNFSTRVRFGHQKR